MTTDPRARAPWLPSLEGNAEPIVFIVDDDKSVAHAFQQLLRTHGYKTQAWTSPHAFLSEHDSSAPGCLLTDLTMQSFDGLALHHALLTRGIRRPVIFVTAQDHPATTEAAMQAGALRVLPKPVSGADLIASVQEAIALDQAERTLRARGDLIDDDDSESGEGPTVAGQTG